MLPQQGVPKGHGLGLGTKIVKLVGQGRQLGLESGLWRRHWSVAGCSNLDVGARHVSGGDSPRETFPSIEDARAQTTW